MVKAKCWIQYNSTTNSNENKRDEGNKHESNDNDVIDVDGTDVKVCIALALRKIA